MAVGVLLFVKLTWECIIRYFEVFVERRSSWSGLAVPEL
jgi:hypothetical protein